VIIVAGHLRVEPAARERYLEACLDVIEQARGAPGCLDFALSVDAIDDDRINVFERWESDALLMRFRCAGPGPELPEVCEAQVTKYRIASEEAP
jgi:quinol monooxygenase YgiN